MTSRIGALPCPLPEGVETVEPLHSVAQLGF